MPRVASRALSVAAICEVRRRILYILLKFSSIVFVKYHVCFLFAQHFDQIELMFVELQHTRRPDQQGWGDGGGWLVGGYNTLNLRLWKN